MLRLEMSGLMCCDGALGWTGMSECMGMCEGAQGVNQHMLAERKAFKKGHDYGQDQGRVMDAWIL